jgi:hypothetical protein
MERKENQVGVKGRKRVDFLGMSEKEQESILMRALTRGQAEQKKLVKEYVESVVVKRIAC